MNDGTHASGPPASRTSSASAGAEAPRRRRWPRVLLLALAALVVLILVAPYVAAPFVRSRVVAALSDALDADVELEQLSFGLGGTAHLAGLAVRERDGRALASVDRLDADVGVLALLGGRIVADVVLDGFEAHVRRGPDGTWSFERGPAAGPEPAPEPAGELPEVELDVVVRGGRVVVHGPAGSGDAGAGGSGAETEIVDLGLELHVPSLAAASSYSLSLGVRGPGLERPASLTVSGTFTALPGGPGTALDPARVRGDLDLALEPLPLSALVPALALAAGPPPAGGGDPLAALAGTLRGEAHLVAGGAGLPTGTADFRVLDLRLPPPAGAADGSAVAPGELAFTLDSSSARDELGFHAGDFLTFSADRTRAPSASGGAGAEQLTGSLALDADLARATRALGPWVPLQAGRKVGGAVVGRYAWSAEQGADGLARGALDGSLELQGLGATDESGAPLDLGELANARLALDADLDLEAGSARVSSFVLDAGPVSVDGRAGFHGFRGADGAFSPADLVVDESRLELTADLDRLYEQLGRLVDLGELSFGGRIALRSEASQADDGIHATSDGSVTGLVLARPGEEGAAPLRFGPVDLGLSQSAVVDLRPGGSTRLERLDLTAPFLKATARGDFTDVTDPERMKGTLHRELSFVPGRGGEELVRFFSGLDVEIASLTQTEDLVAEAGTFRWTGKLAASGLALGAAGEAGGGAAAGPPAPPASLALSYAGAYTLADGRLELSALNASAARGALTGTLVAAGTLEAGRFVLERAQLRAPGVELDTHGEASGLGAPAGGAKPSVRFETTGRIVPDELNVPLASAAPGLAVAGEPLAWSSRLVVADGALTLAGEATGDRFELTLPPGAEGGTSYDGAAAADDPAPRTLRQRGLHLAFDLGANAESPGERLDVRSFEYASESGRVTASGHVAALTDPARTAADLTLEATSELGTLLADLGGLTGAEDGSAYDAAGTLTARYELKGGAGHIALTGATTIKDLRASLGGPRPAAGEAAAPGSAAQLSAGAPLVVTEPELRLELGLGLDTGPLDVTLDRVHLASRMLWGDLSGSVRNLRGLAAAEGSGAAGAAAADGEARVEGLHGTFHYVPDRLGVVLAPWLPGTLSGAEEELVEFRFDGALADLEPSALLRGLDGSATLGLGHFLSVGFDTEGQLELDMSGDQVATRGALSANHGTLDLDARLDLREPAEAGAAAAGGEGPVSWLKVKLAGVDANPEVSPLLGMLHPAFAALDRSKAGSLTGVLNGELELYFDGPLTPASLAEGWTMLPKNRIHGSGRLQIDGATLSGSPLLTSMLSLFGEGDAARELKLDPIEFRIDAGRIGYLKPWQWTIAGTKTSFGGTIGLDRTLDLKWSVPVTDALIAKHGFLADLKGGVIELPIGGTVTRPKLSVQDALKTVAQDALKAGLKGELEKKLGGDLGSLLGGKPAQGEAPGAEGQPAPPTPEELLKQADDLWAKGEQAAAAALYRELREKHELTIVYQLNKKRIKERAKEPEPPESSGTGETP